MPPDDDPPFPGARLVGQVHDELHYALGDETPIELSDAELRDLLGDPGYRGPNSHFDAPDPGNRPAYARVGHEDPLLLDYLAREDQEHQYYLTRDDMDAINRSPIAHEPDPAHVLEQQRGLIAQAHASDIAAMEDRRFIDHVEDVQLLQQWRSGSVMAPESLIRIVLHLVRTAAGWSEQQASDLLRLEVDLRARLSVPDPRVRTVTGRMTASEPNLQNVPESTPIGDRIRDRLAGLVIRNTSIESSFNRIETTWPTLPPPPPPLMTREQEIAGAALAGAETPNQVYRRMIEAMQVQGRPPLPGREFRPGHPLPEEEHDASTLLVGCSGCGGSGYERHLGMDNDEIVSDCLACGGLGSISTFTELNDLDVCTYCDGYGQHEDLTECRICHGSGRMSNLRAQEEHEGMSECHRCGGTWVLPPSILGDDVICTLCAGSGELPSSLYADGGLLRPHEVTCPSCTGRGSVLSMTGESPTCTTCHGRGRIEQPRPAAGYSLSTKPIVMLPPGVLTGSKLDLED